MIGTRYWSTGITVRYTRIDQEGPAWSGELSYEDSGGPSDRDADTGQISTIGTLSTRYFVSHGQRVDALTAVIDRLLADASALGVAFLMVANGELVENRGFLHYYGAGRPGSAWPPPVDWRDVIASQAQRIGWRSPYELEEFTTPRRVVATRVAPPALLTASPQGD